MNYNHDRELDSFQEDIKILKENGFNPIAVSQMYLEDTFVFETEEEAQKAYKRFEDVPKGEDKLCVGWWYGLEKFKESVIQYETESAFKGTKVKIFWLDEKFGS